MSLLLEALKKAEIAKRGTSAAAQPAPESPLSLESPPGTDEAEAVLAPAAAPVGNELPFPEISLSELEPQETEAPQPSPAPVASPEAGKAILPELEPEPAPSLNLEIESRMEPALSLDLPPSPAPTEAPAPSAIENNLQTVSQPDMPLASEPLLQAKSPQSAPTEVEQNPAAIAPPAIPVPEYSPPLPQHTPPEPAAINQHQETARKILSVMGEKPKRNLKLLAGILAGSMAVGATAAYYYWQTASQPRIAVRLPPPAPPVQAPPPAAAPQQPAAPEPPRAVAAAVPSSKQPDGPASAQHVAGGTPVAPAEPAPRRTLPRKQPSEAEKTTPSNDNQASKEPAVPPAPKKAAPSPDRGIDIRREAGELQLDPLLANAYQAYMAGDANKADADYRKALQQNPNSRDALLGLAAIAANRGLTDEAAGHYLRLLQLNPKDAAAQAGLIGLKGYTDPTASESRLKLLLSQSPDAAYLHFALGNLYAHLARWPEAQEAFFNAFHADPGNADYAFNLAVSLDHLGQRKPAQTYYQRALSLAKERSGGFDREQLKKRIHELQEN